MLLLHMQIRRYFNKICDINIYLFFILYHLFLDYWSIRIQLSSLEFNTQIHTCLLWCTKGIYILLGIIFLKGANIWTSPFVYKKQLQAWNTFTKMVWFIWNSTQIQLWYVLVGRTIRNFTVKSRAPIKCETKQKRNETKRNQQKRNETKRNQ